MRSIVFPWWIASCLVLPLPLQAAEPLTEKIEEILKRPAYKQSDWGILVVDAGTGKTIYERNPDRFFAPASTTKLFSCASALMAFGSEFRFETPIYQKGEVKEGVLKGDLILVASGDLTLGGRIGKNGKTLFANFDHTYANTGVGQSEPLDANPLAGLQDLAKQVAKSGIKEIQGEILIDDRLFTRSRGTGSGPEVITPILVNDNVIDLLITPGSKSGEPAKVKQIPETNYLQMDVDVLTDPKDKSPTITIESVGPNQFTVRGSIPEGSKPIVRIVTVDEPILFARTLFFECLKREGIRISCSAFRPAVSDLPPRDSYSSLKKVASFKSVPFSEMITVTLKVSHNLYASTLPLLVAAKKGDKTLDEGMKWQGKFLKELGVDTQMISFSSGAGGSNADSTTPRGAIQLLQGMAKRPDAKAYFDALPILGIDGSLSEAVPSTSPVKGKVQAKTGTFASFDSLNERILLKSKALVGQLETAKGTKLYFAMFVNNVPVSEPVHAIEEGKVLGKICEIIHELGP